MKLVPTDNPADADLRGDVGQTGDQHDGNALFLDLLRDRSAATRAGASRRG